MSKKDHQTVRRTGSSFFYGGLSLFMFFPYEQLTWNFALFCLALCGVALASVNLIAINRARAAAKDGVCTFSKRTGVMARIAWWLTFVPFLVVVIGFVLTGVLACSLYL